VEDDNTLFGGVGHRQQIGLIERQLTIDPATHMAMGGRQTMCAG